MTTLHRPQPEFNVTLTAAFKLTQRSVDIPVGSIELKQHGGSVEKAPASQSSTCNAAVLPLRDICFSMAAITKRGSLISINRPSTMCRIIDALGNTTE